jgi:hypothetical protein
MRIWTTRDGITINIEDMDVKHLENTISFLDRVCDAASQLPIPDELCVSILWLEDDLQMLKEEHSKRKMNILSELENFLNKE